MKRQVCWTNPAFICLCCGGLPFLLLLKFVLAVVLPLAIIPVVLFSVAVVLTPVWLFHIYWTAAVTPYIGWEIKIALLLVIYFPIFLVPIITLIASPVYVVVWTAITIFNETMFDGNLWLGGFKETALDIYDHVVWIIGIATYDAIQKMKYIRHPDEPYTHIHLSVWWTPVAIVAAIVGALLVGLTALVNTVIKIIPLTLGRMWKWTTDFWKMDEFNCLRAALVLPWCIALVLHVVAVPMIALACVLCAFLYGLWAFTIVFRYEFKGVLWWIGSAMAYVENAVNEELAYLFDCDVCYTLPTADMTKLRSRDIIQRVGPDDT